MNFVPILVSSLLLVGTGRPNEKQMMNVRECTYEVRSDKYMVVVVHVERSLCEQEKVAGEVEKDRHTTLSICRACQSC